MIGAGCLAVLMLPFLLVGFVLVRYSVRASVASSTAESVLEALAEDDVAAAVEEASSSRSDTEALRSELMGGGLIGIGAPECQSPSHGFPLDRYWGSSMWVSCTWTAPMGNSVSSVVVCEPSGLSCPVESVGTDGYDDWGGRRVVHF